MDERPPASLPEPARESPQKQPAPRRRGVLAMLAALLATCALLAPHVARVPDDDMAPTLLAGDLVLVVPGTPVQGDLVALVDPLDPSRWSFRRVESVGGQVRVEDGVYLTGNRVDLLELGRDDAYVTRREGAHLVRRAARMPRGEAGPFAVPDDAAFLGADARDEAMDSRWWGPVPLAAIQGRVLLRVGPPRHAWRGWVGG